MNPTEGISDSGVVVWWNQLKLGWGGVGLFNVYAFPRFYGFVSMLVFVVGILDVCLGFNSLGLVLFSI